MDPNDPAYRGQAEYTPRLLAVYDWFVLRFMAQAVWRAASDDVVERYRRLMGRRHLDVGPGTGYFLVKANRPDVEVTLLDPNPNVLAHASQQLGSRSVETVEADVLKPLPIDGPFDSAGLNYVLHCLPGPQISKGSAIRHVAAVLTPEGVLFGGTVLGRTARHTPQARVVLWAFNRRGTFGNLDDTESGLRQILEDSFQRVEIDSVGSMAYFTATGPRGRGMIRS